MVSIGIGIAALAILAFGAKLSAIYVSALASLGVSPSALDFFDRAFPVLRWFFAPAALALAILSYFIR